MVPEDRRVYPILEEETETFGEKESEGEVKLSIERPGILVSSSGFFTTYDMYRETYSEAEYFPAGNFPR